MKTATTPPDPYFGDTAVFSLIKRQKTCFKLTVIGCPWVLLTHKWIITSQMRPPLIKPGSLRLVETDMHRK